jgi:hypothetical protein
MHLMPLNCLAAICAIFLALFGQGQSAAQGQTAGARARNHDPEVLGEWQGTSTCLVKPSSCQDEEALYRVKAAAAPGRYSVEGNKIVQGKVVFMGVMDCGFDARQSLLHCEFERGTVDLTLREGHLNGFMLLKDKMRWRRIELRKA